ncbi:MAG: crossover junction endodeoxyribonuclease RuvC [Patescibacteria group bacterium]
MRVIGIDPGLATIGLGVVDSLGPDDLRVVEWLTIETKPGALGSRLKEIRTDLSDYIKKLKPDLAVVEKIFFAINERTAIDVAHARGVILETIASRSLPIIEPTPLELKSSLTGDGQADKRQMQDMLKLLLKIEEIPRPDDAADALGLAVFGALYHKKRTMLA